MKHTRATDVLQFGERFGSISEIAVARAVVGFPV